MTELEQNVHKLIDQKRQELQILESKIKNKAEHDAEEVHRKLVRLKRILIAAIVAIVTTSILLSLQSSDTETEDESNEEEGFLSLILKESFRMLTQRGIQKVLSGIKTKNSTDP